MTSEHEDAPRRPYVTARRVLGFLAGAVLAVGVTTIDARLSMTYLPRPWSWVAVVSGAVVGGLLGRTLYDQLSAPKPWALMTTTSPPPSSRTPWHEPVITIIALLTVAVVTFLALKCLIG